MRELPHPDSLTPVKRHIPNADEAKVALSDHVIDRALLARERHGPDIDLPALEAILADRKVVRYPVELSYGADALEPGEFAFAEPLGEHPSAGFRIWIHPRFQGDPRVPLLVAYHLVVVNYGDIATAEDAELFGATLHAMERDAYYAVLCEAADALS